MVPVLNFDCGGLSEVMGGLSALAANANAAGESIVPVKHAIAVANLDDCFAGYDGSFRPCEDGFALPTGHELM